MNEQLKAWAREGARLSIVAALDAFPELAKDFGTTVEARLARYERQAETIAARRVVLRPVRPVVATKPPRRLSPAARKAISVAAKARWVKWRLARTTKGKK